MRIQKLELKHFRNYERATLLPDPALTVLVGQNAQGKTNVLEALHLCCLGKSHRTAHDREMITWGQHYAGVKLEVSRRDGTHEIQVLLSDEDKRRKVIRVGASPIGRIGELMGHFHGVFFTPEDLAIVKQGPSERRRFIDMELSQLRPAYFYALQQYVRALNQRNNLLKDIQKNASLQGTLPVWDEQLVRSGAQVILSRQAYIEKLGLEARIHHAQLSGGTEELSVAYRTQVPLGPSEEAIAEAFLRALEKNRREDIRRASTGVGPHRDELKLSINGKEVRLFGSQGQQRTTVLSLKLAELTVATKEREEAPVLLLDDVMSELDVRRRQQLIERIEGIQTLVTCTHLSDLGGAKYGAAYQVEQGTLSRVEE